MNAKDIVMQQFLEVVNNQIRDNDPAETGQTLERLKKEGYSDQAARLLIAQCVASEFIELLHSDQPFDPQRYIDNLHRLPETPPEG
jgi:hypothetical protein